MSKIIKDGLLLVMIKRQKNKTKIITFYKIKHVIYQIKHSDMESYKLG